MAVQTGRDATADAVHSAVAVRRFVNDSIYEAGVQLGGEDGHAFEFLCECGDLGCLAVVAMTLEQYRRHPAGSVVHHA